MPLSSTSPASISQAQPANDAKSSRASGNRLRIMHVIDRLDIGGTEKVMMKIVQHLNPDRFEHSICTLRGATDRARLWQPDIELLDAGVGGSDLQFNVLRLSKIMKRIRPAIVHSRNWGGIEAVWAARLAGVPVAIHSEHGYQLEMQSGLPWRQRLLRHLSYKCATSVFAVTDELRRYHEAQAGCPAGSIQVLYNGVDTHTFQPRPGMASRIRRELDISPDQLVVGFVGRLIALKNIVTLLKAVDILAPEVPNIHVLVVGSGPELPRLKDHAQNSPQLKGRVSFTGPLDDVASLFNAMDVFVLPSLLEGMSNTILEAMASGLPVIASRVGGNPEVVDDGVCGFLFRGGESIDLSCKLRTLLRDQNMRAKFGEAARAKAVQIFSLDGMLDRYSKLYLTLAREQGVQVPEVAHVRN